MKYYSYICTVELAQRFDPPKGSRSILQPRPYFFSIPQKKGETFVSPLSYQINTNINLLLPFQEPHQFLHR
jgi:hypothetical protein